MLFYRTCYFTIAATHKKNDFVNCLSESFGSGGLACSFNDKELIQYISWKKKRFHQDNNAPQIEKQGVLTLGKQPCGDIWVLSQECFIHKSGVVSTDHKYRWLNKLVTFGNTQREMSLEQITCKVSLPLSLHNFPALVQQLERCLEHNFISGMLCIGGAVMMFHYRKLIQLYSFCPQLVAFGPPSTGKTLSLRVGLSLFGADNQRNHYNNCSKAYCLLRSSISTIPFFLDDPKIASQIAELIICYFNGTIPANVVHGDTQPLTCPLFATNFSIGNDKRYDCMKCK